MKDGIDNCPPIKSLIKKMKKIYNLLKFNWARFAKDKKKATLRFIRKGFAKLYHDEMSNSGSVQLNDLDESVDNNKEDTVQNLNPSRSSQESNEEANESDLFKLFDISNEDEL